MIRVIDHSTGTTFDVELVVKNTNDSYAVCDLCMSYTGGRAALNLTVTDGTLADRIVSDASVCPTCFDASLANGSFEAMTS